MGGTRTRLVFKRAAAGGLCLAALLVVLFMVVRPSTDTTSPATATSDIDHHWRESHGSGLRVRVSAASAKPLALDFSDAWRVSHGNGLRFGIPAILGKPLPLDFSIAPAGNR